MRGRSVLNRLLAPLRSRRGAVRDENFIGFDKYRRQGAYHWTELETSPDYRQKAELLVERAGAGDAVLDLGCGDGAYVYMLSGKAGRVVGVDADYDAVRLANKELERHGVQNAQCLQLPLSQVTRQAVGASDGFDLVYSMDVIEHLPRPEEMVEVAVAMAKPGATIVIGTPLHLGDHLVSEYHVREFTADEIGGLLRRGMVVTEELAIPMRRLDGKVYDEGFYVGIGHPA